METKCNVIGLQKYDRSRFLCSMAANLRMLERAEEKARTFYFVASAVAEKWPQLSPMEVAAVVGMFALCLRK